MRTWSQLGLGRTPPDEVVPDVPLAGDGQGPRLRDRESAAPRVSRPPKRSLLQPLPLAGIALVLVALVGYVAVYNQTTRRTDVLVAARDLAAGTVLRPADLRSAGLAGDETVLGSIVSADRREAVVGRRLAVPVAAGQPLARKALAGRAAVPSAFTVAVPALNALGGGLQPGDRVTVLATFDATAEGARTQAIARGLEVLSVGQPPADFQQASATIPITLALPTPSLASALALANQAGKIDLLREGTRGGGSPIPPATPGG